MDTNIKEIVSMLASKNKITLFTISGEVLDMLFDGLYDTLKIAEFLTTQLSGGNVVPIDLNKYLSLQNALTTEYEQEGMPITYMVNGKEIQGIFYPQKVEVKIEMDDGEQVTIPKVEKLNRHMNRAANENSPAVRNFLRRLAPVAKDRLHSAEDLMDFIEKSELPLTNDGKIIGYKRVNKKGDYFVDCHSKQIKQRLGSRVWMDINAVDPSRNKSCSHGLHVANLGYLRSFYGDFTLIVLVDPADFIAVPHGETNKCRVCSYDIIGVMSSDNHKIVSSGAHIEGDYTLESIISNAVEGNYIKPFETVKVGQKKVLEVLPISEPTKSDIVIEQSKAKSKPSGKSLNMDKKQTNQKKKDIRKMASKIKGNNDWDNAPDNVMVVFEEMRVSTDSKSAIAACHNTSTRTIGRWMDKYDYNGYVASREASMTIAERAQSMFKKWRETMNEAVLAELVAFKKARKKSWYSFGFKQSQINQIEKAS